MLQPNDRLAAVTAALAWTGAGIVLVCALAAAASGPGYSMGFWTVRTGFTILRWSAQIAAGAGIVSLAAIALAAIRGTGVQLAVSLAGFAIAAALVLPAWSLQNTASQVPRIHDITTDTENPPQFVALLPVRMTSPNGAAYGGAKVAAAQKAAYPDIQPARLAVPPAQAFERALAAARDMGWEIAAAEQAEGRIEATATTFWFRFKDDVVIRIAAEGEASKLDIRSMSRIGRSDLGANARRIRAFLKRL
jgi:uncharacterized protein (DUF1499 family)